MPFNTGTKLSLRKRPAPVQDQLDTEDQDLGLEVQEVGEALAQAPHPVALDRREVSMSLAGDDATDTGSNEQTICHDFEHIIKYQPDSDSDKTVCHQVTTTVKPDLHDHEWVSVGDPTVSSVEEEGGGVIPDTPGQGNSKLDLLRKSRPRFYGGPSQASANAGGETCGIVGASNPFTLDSQKVGTVEDPLDPTGFFKTPKKNAKGKGKAKKDRNSEYVDSLCSAEPPPMAGPSGLSQGPRAKSSKMTATEKEVAFHKVAYYKAQHSNALKQGELLSRSLETEMLKQRILRDHLKAAGSSKE